MKIILVMMTNRSVKNKIKITELLARLNDPVTGCSFWKTSVNQVSGVRPITRTTKEIINPDHFTPYEKITEEHLFNFFILTLLPESDNNTPHTWTTCPDGTLEAASPDIEWLLNFVRMNK